MAKERERSRSGPPEKRPAPHSTYARSRRQQKKSGPPAWVYIAAVAAVVVLVGGGAITILGQGGAPGPTAASNAGGSTGSSSVQLPRFAYVAPQVTEAYEYAVTQEGQDVLQYMPCYCGCGEHSGHKSNKNCFLQDTAPGQPLVFDNHAST